MSTINQLVRRRRHKLTRKSKAVALTVDLIRLKTAQPLFNSPFKRGVCTKVTTKTRRNLTLLFERSLVFALQMDLK